MWQPDPYSEKSTISEVKMFFIVASLVKHKKGPGGLY